MPLQAGKKFAELTARRKRPQQQNTQPQFFAAQQGGVNAIAGAATAPADDALIMLNMIPAEFGVTVRLGYREHCLPVPLGDGINTLMPLVAETVGSVKKLFACTNDGIYDVSTAGGAPVKVVDFTVKGGNAGWCSWCNFSNIAGQWLLVCDEANGYYIHDIDANTWTKVTMGAAAGQVESDSLADYGPIDPANFDFVMVWKKRVWFIERGTGKGWYLDVGTITGPVKAFQFGNKFKYGGHLKALYNWTLDGGEGVDDYLISLSSAGDMIVYKGTNPDTTDFGAHGSWFIGRVPEGRRCGEDNGGDLLILSVFGMLQPSKLIGGLPLTDQQASLSYKINPRINEVLSRSVNMMGWQVKQDPKNLLTIIITPKELGRDYMQFAYHTATKAWAQFVGVPMRTAESWDGQFYFGDEANRVYTYAGNLDRVMLADAGATANSIEWELLTTFQAMGQPAQFKRVQLLRPMFIGGSVPSYLIAARYDFDLSSLPGSPTYIPPGGGLWDTGLWDTDVWGGGYIVNQPPYGGNGVGRHIALSIRGRSTAQTIYVGTDVLLDGGGLL